MPYEVFISFKRNALDGSGKTRDYELAADLHRTLTDAGIETFMSERDVYISDFRKQIDDALDEAKILIAVGTCREHMDSENVRYEWWTFNDDILSRDKPDAQIFSYIEGMKKADLPRALRRLQFFYSNEKEQLVAVVCKNLGRPAPQPKPQPVSEPKPKPIEQKPIVKQQPVQKPAPQSAPYKNLHVGDKIPFGKYPQGANGEVQPLMWRVLAVESGRALLITDDLIDAVPYNEENKIVTWETCTLRKWMNNDFLQTAFNSEEQARIATVTNQNPNNPEYGTKGGNPTDDRVFALSVQEAWKYFRSDEDRMAAPTAYAIKRGAGTRGTFSLKDRRKTGWWWLRSPGDNSNSAAFVDTRGHVSQFGVYVNVILGAVRPAFWLNQ